MCIKYLKKHLFQKICVQNAKNFITKNKNTDNPI